MHKVCQRKIAREDIDLAAGLPKQRNYIFIACFFFSVCYFGKCAPLLFVNELVNIQRREILFFSPSLDFFQKLLLSLRSGWPLSIPPENYFQRTLCPAAECFDSKRALLF